MSAAPLKRPAARRVPPRRETFPHSDECGPIEAPASPAAASPARPGFRTQMSAAPLKRDRPRSAGRDLAEFPHSDECGPIEASDVVEENAGYTYWFPHSDECGPIEARRRRPPLT